VTRPTSLSPWSELGDKFVGLHSMIFSVTGIELVFLDYQVFLAQTKKASVLEIERKFVLF
jgi:hypothetical protein